MGWDVIAGLIVNYGLPFADKMVTLWTTETPLTAENWAALQALSQQNALSQMKAALARAGIPETDPHAVALLAQVPS